MKNFHEEGEALRINASKAWIASGALNFYGWPKKQVERPKPHEQRIEWAKEALGMDLHKGQKRALTGCERVQAGKVHYEFHGRRWGKTYWVVADLLTYAMMYPERLQIILANTINIVDHCYRDKMRSVLERAKQDPFVMEKFPILRCFEVNQRGVFLVNFEREAGSSQDEKNPLILWDTTGGSWKERNIQGRKVDRIIVDEFTYTDPYELAELLRLTKTLPVKLLLVGGHDGLDPEAPGVTPEMVAEHEKRVGY